MDKILFGENTIKEFKAAYKKAAAAGVEMFEFDGHQFLVSYAYWVIEYLDMEIKRGVKRG